MLKTVSAIAACAALAATALIVLPGISPNVEASASATDGSAGRTPSDCALRSWPYYDRGCLRDETRDSSRVPAVRIVTTDRVHEAKAVQYVPAAPLQDAALVPVQDAPAVSQDNAGPQAPSSWPMADGEVRVYLAAGDFIRRTVR